MSSPQPAGTGRPGTQQENFGLLSESPPTTNRPGAPGSNVNTPTPPSASSGPTPPPANLVRGGGSRDASPARPSPASGPGPHTDAAPGPTLTRITASPSGGISRAGSGGHLEPASGGNRPQQASGGGFQGFDAPAAIGLGPSSAKNQSPPRGAGEQPRGIPAGSSIGGDLSRSGALAGLSGQTSPVPGPGPGQPPPAAGQPSHGLAAEFSSPTRHSAGGAGAGGAVHLGGRGVGQFGSAAGGQGSRSPSPRKEDRPWETQHIEYSPDLPPSPRSVPLGPHVPGQGHGHDGASGSRAGGSAGAGAGHGGSPVQPRAYFATSSTHRAAEGAEGGGRDTLLSRDEENTMVSGFRAGIRHSGWLHKLVGKTPQDINWKRYWFYLCEDRLYYTTEMRPDAPVSADGGKVRYIALDRIPVRPLPHRRGRVDPTKLSVPDIGVAMIGTRVLAHLGVKLKPDTCLGIVSGSHTYFLAADTPQEAKAWVKALRAAWLHCFKHTLRGGDGKEAVHETSRLLAQNEYLRRTLRDAQRPAVETNESEYWKQWLEEKARNRSLEEALANNAVYEIEVKTGKMKGASTDARVYIEMYGPYDSVTTGDIRLVNADSHQRSYTRGALDLFIVTAKDVGLPKVIKVWHDNTGRHPDWFLEYVRVRKRAGKATPGPAPVSVGSPRADPAAVRLQHTGAHSMPASPLHGPGSPGMAPHQQQHHLRSPGAPHHQLRISAASSPGGPSAQRQPALLTAMASPSASWQHQSVSIPGTSASPGGMQMGMNMGGPWSPWVSFPCQRWFSTQMDDCRISRLLYAGHQSPLIQYKVKTLTSDMRGASTDANVHLVMHGTLGDGIRHVLTGGHDDFARGATNEFIIDDEELGDLLEVTVGHDNSGHHPSWHLDHLTITNMKTGQTFIFPCRQWFDTRVGDGHIERVLPVAADAGKLVPYVFNISTSDLRGAGTDADVHVALHGELGDTPTTVLPSRPEHFERGQTDSFRLVLPWVGEVRALTIGHNNKGPGPEWHLEMVEVIDEQHGPKSYWFACNRWLAVGMEDGLLERTLLVSKEDPRKAYADYKVDFYTSNLRGAGTDATVFFQLVGDGGESEVQRVVAPKEAFERGGVDSFMYRMRFLGKLRRMLIQHDNSGANPAWHLFKVVVTDSRTKTPTTFVCNDWIRTEDPQGPPPSVELLADLPVPLITRYRLEVFTTDMRGAGTDSGVFIEIHGMQGKVPLQQLDNPAAFDRGAKDVFHVEGIDVGQLTKLVVSLDGRGSRPLWHLDYILVYRGDTLADSQEAAVFFPCRQWFDRERGMTKELYPMRREADLVKIPYVVRVFTSDLKGAGTDASIDVGVIGSRGETGWHRLVANHDTFERAQEDVFTLTMLDVGVPQWLLVKTDAKSQKPTWHLDFVVVEPFGDGRAPAAFFVGQCWLGPAPQYKSEVKLPAVREDPRGDRAEYLVWVHTSDVRFAGTDASITLEILGDRGSSGRKPLVDASKDLFERAQVDEFRVQCRQLGSLRAIRVESDCKSSKPNWHLDYVVIQAPSGEKYYFPWANWIGQQCPLVEIPAQLSDPTQGRKVYKVTTYTSDLRGASTDANVYVDIKGAQASTGRQFLKNANPNCFERGQADDFEVRAPGELGPLTELVVGHDNSGQGPSWHLEQVDVTDVRTGQTWYFDCNNWFDTTQGDGLIERVLKPSLQNPRTARTVYYVVVKTSTIPNAGTDARVYIDMHGEHGASGKIFLKNTSANPFESGQSDEFQVPCRSLGALTELVLGHDNSGLNPNWHCELVSITDLATKTTYYFACNKWFDLSKDDGKIERILKASLQPPSARRDVPYQITVKTSNIDGAGTDANVWVILYGEDGADTGRLKLNKAGNNFEKGKTDVFDVTAKEVDPLRKLRVGHDNSGVGPAWHLASIEVLNKATGARYIFNCNKWLSTKHGDFQIERDLYPLGSNISANTYTISVHTSDITGAGTDANVYCTLYGEKGETGEMLLDNPKNNFERGCVDVFNIEQEDVGKLTRMKVRSDGKGMGAAWHLDIITVVSSAKPDVMYWFYCGQWFDDEHGLEKSLTAFLSDPRGSLPTYTVTVHTSDIAGAGTDANVFINLFGTKGESGVRDLKGSGNLFERGKADKFTLRMVDLGDLTELEVWHDNSGLGPAWHLDYIEVHSSATGRTYYFPCAKWFDKKQGDGLIRRRLIATLKDPRSFNSDYRVTTVTSDISGAGTDANVHIIIYGAEGDTGKVVLDNPMKNDFERGQTDVFEFKARAVGSPMSKIRIGHDGSGFGAGWHLARVIVENLSTGECVTFECNKWLDKGKEDGLIERELFPSQSIVGGINWKMTIITGTESGAGTDANVFCSVRGDKGQFGPHQLPAQKGAFETGSHDVFSLTTPDITPLRELTLGHDGKGLGAAWYVDTAEMEIVATGEKWWFEFKCWLDSKHGMSATRPPCRYRGPTRGGLTDYRVEFTTGPTDESRLEKGSLTVDIRSNELATGRQTVGAPPMGFWPNRVEKYLLSQLKDTGGITQLELGLEAPEPFFVAEVLVVNEKTGVSAAFPINKLLNPGEYTVFNAKESAPVDYEVEVATSDRFNAGTSAHPFVNIFGLQGSTGRVNLEAGLPSGNDTDGGSAGTLPAVCSTADACRPRSTALQRGGQGKFLLRQLPDVGTMTQLEVGHDNAGLSPGWHLAWVRVTNLGTGATALFPCNQWLSKGEGDKKIERILDAEEVGKGSAQMPPTAVAVVTVNTPQEVPQVHDSPLLRKLGIGGVLGEPGYKLLFHTSNVCMAGTNAPVFFELIGQNGSTGVVMTRATMGQFARGSRDEFIYPRMPFLGEIVQLRVGTTGQGMFAAWHLREVEVVHLSSGDTWVFGCHDWVNKECRWQRVITAKRKH